jgi:GT2 family glycosyltransferase/SAM-dependent methyltransferase
MRIKALFFNHKHRNCGVHEYGRLLADKLNGSAVFDLKYLEISSESDFIKQVEVNQDASVSFANYHPETVPWLTKDVVQAVRHPIIGIMHEFGYFNAFYEGSQIFDFRALIDPSVRSRVPNVTVHPRVVVGDRPSTLPRDEFTVGSFGFGTPSKCFDHVVTLVKREFDKATIRFNIPAAAFGDPEGIEARKIAETCKQLVGGTGITLEVNHEFLSPQELVEFLGENTINVFCYTSNRGRGLSSAVDFAVASGRPFAVSDGTMFRHLRHLCPEVFLSKNGIRGILEYGAEPANRLRSLWSDENLLNSFRDAACNAIDAFQKYANRERLFNVALDNVERSRYAHDVDEMTESVPEIMSKKIAEANVQQAFVKSSVEHFADGRRDLNILCVGSFEDTAYETLKKNGYSITAIDPAVDMDLSTFYGLRSTAKSSFDIIFSTSVMEHVENDELFVSEMTDLLAVGGVAILTTDFNDGYGEGDVKPYTDYRLYTIRDILLRLVPLMHSCGLVGPHFWQRSSPDFTFEGARYSFVSLVFRKNREVREDAVFAQDLREELLELFDALTPQLRSEQERLKTEIMVLDQAKMILEQDSADLSRMRKSRYIRIIWAVREKLTRPLHSAKIVSRYLLNAIRSGWKSTAHKVFNTIYNVAREQKNKFPFVKDSYDALAAKLRRPTNMICPTVADESRIPARLGDDYGMERNDWLTYQKILLNSIRPKKHLGNQRKGKLWICMCAKTPTTAPDWKKALSNLESLEHKCGRPIGLMLFDMMASEEEFAPFSKFRVVKDLDRINALMGTEDTVLFIDVSDVIEQVAVQILEEQGAFAADLALFDFYYLDGPRAYPIFLHGVDVLHGAHCDYFFSRFLVSARLFKQETSKRANMSLRDAVVSCLAATDASSTIHIPIPLLCACLKRSEVLEAKVAATAKFCLSGGKLDDQVSAIICTKDNHFLLRQLVWRLKRERAIKDIIIVSNNSLSLNMHLLLNELKTSGDATVLTYNKQFNFSEQSNLGASVATGDSFLFINDDIAPVNDEWLHLLIESGAWKGGSIAGPLLIYPDQRVQHAGMFLGFNNTAGHLMRFSGIPDETSGFGLHAPRKVACVTGAAMLVPREAFENLNGFDTSLAYYLQDVDLCMRATCMGLDVVFDPRSVLIHFESVSVKPILTEPHFNCTREREFAYFCRRWPLLKDNLLNPNISPQDETMKSLWCPTT